MKKILLFALLGLSATMFAQNDLSVTLNEPTASSMLGAGIPFTYEITITNNGSSAIPASDTTANIPLFNGAPITGLFFLRNKAIPAGNSKTFTEYLTITGGVTGSFQICSFAFVLGNSEMDSTDNLACVTTNWDAALSTGDLEIAVIKNNSFYANGIYTVAIEGAYGLKDATVSIINLNGQTISSTPLDINAGIVEGAINVEHLPAGIYIIDIHSSTGKIGSQKVMIQ